MNFANRYGPWAIVAGASEGTGRAFARQIAASGVSCLLFARREGPLVELASEIRAEYGVECVTAAIDLSAPDAFDRIIAAVGSREVGLYVANAGADPNGTLFLDRDVKAWTNLVQVNVMTKVLCCHHFGGRMRAREKGGLLLLNSGACYGGSSYLTTYSASKAFVLNFAEGLWSELKPHGVDVLTLVMGQTDTPAFRKYMAEHGMPFPENAASPDEVARVGLARLPHGPIRNWGLEDEEAGYAGTSADARRAKVVATDAMMRQMLGTE